MALVAFALFCLTASVCHAQNHETVCSAGSGTFESQFHTGVRVSVVAARNDGLATRACAAELSWNKQKLAIAAAAPRIDVDAFGADLGAGVPVVAIQVQKSAADCCMSYQIYSLEKPPRLLRTITGGDAFGAADTDLDGRVEIWTDDSAAVDGFEHFDVRELDFAPPIVLRFSNGQLLDVSAEFQSFFDQQIAKLRADLDVQQLGDFKNTDGRLMAAPTSLDELRQSDYLHDVKRKVLEIVWSYVYSGREEEAWRSLADMWPPEDVDRIRAAIVQARARGIRSQVDGVSAAVPTGRKEHVEIFDGIRPPSSIVPALVPSGRRGIARIFDGMSSTSKSDLVLPEPIQLWSPLKMDASDEVVMDLVIDCAGKVRSAEPVDHTKRLGEDLIAATAEWKFIPGFKDGRPVASRVRMSVSPKM